MAFIKIYIYDEKGLYRYSRKGDISTTMNSSERAKEKYTLTPPPDDKHQWRWIDSKWTTDDTA